MMSYLQPLNDRQADETPTVGTVPHGTSWRLFRISHWVRLNLLRVRGSEASGHSASEHPPARDVVLPMLPVVDSLNGTFFSGSRWQRPP